MGSEMCIRDRVEWRRVRQRGGGERSVPAWEVPARVQAGEADWTPATVLSPAGAHPGCVTVRYGGDDAGVAGVEASVPRARLRAPWAASPRPSTDGCGWPHSCCRWGRAPSDVARRVHEQPAVLFGHAVMPAFRSARV